MAESGHKPEDVKSLLQQITKAVLERALKGELTCGAITGSA